MALRTGSVLSLRAVLSFIIMSFLAACSGGSGAGGGTTTTPLPPSTASQWTWVSGSNTTNASGVYGTLGSASAANVPGSRDGSVSWMDSSGNLWLFGGIGINSSGVDVLLNDLWEFNPTSKQWTWVSGSSTANASGSYGTLGVPTATNVPGARSDAVSWMDSSGNLWLFGGFGLAPIGGGSNYYGYLNDLWEFSPTSKQWTWIGGTKPSGLIGAPGVYGTLGVPAATNVPGARSNAISWTDGKGNLWLFGGLGYDSTAAQNDLNDLWEFSVTAKTWTWVSGSSTGNARGVYGTLGVPTATNVPGARGSSSSWLDSSGNLWLFGGAGDDSTGTGGILNDLWEFNPTSKQWTWVSGSSTRNAAGIYGTLGSGVATNTPGARNGSVSWIDSVGNLWLFGGDGFDSTGTGGSIGTGLNDLWKFNPISKTWTWVSGSNLENATGVYGTLGTASTTNVPSARYSAVGWIDGGGNLWLFGGQPPSGKLNDLWRYQP